MNLSASHFHVLIKPGNKVKSHIDNPIEGVAMTQYHVFKGLKMFGKDGFAALDKELHELQMREVVLPLNLDKMTQQSKRDVISM